ncbi:hypothetical protein TSUD_118510 [Trifolium subterraneum]|uniref:Uncharacterized protein n=1 Tax=Trifolium subterraneum TaxID=3900 RepID=A0A2Z6M754_TRISU|nr:hypothetical protein TSUD_118510 [Trifolium subterraneum]
MLLLLKHNRLKVPNRKDRIDSDLRLAAKGRSIAEAGVFHHSSTQESTNVNTIDDKELKAAHAESSNKAMLNGPVAPHADASKAKSDAILAKRERFKSRNVNDTYSINECVTVLNMIEDVTDDIFIKALEKFMDPGWSEAFHAMPNDKRKGRLLIL